MPRQVVTRRVSTAAPIGLRMSAVAFLSHRTKQAGANCAGNSGRHRPFGIGRMKLAEDYGAELRYSHDMENFKTYTQFYG